MSRDQGSAIGNILQVRIDTAASWDCLAHFFFFRSRLPSRKKRPFLLSLAGAQLFAPLHAGEIHDSLEELVSSADFSLMRDSRKAWLPLTFMPECVDA